MAEPWKGFATIDQPAPNVDDFCKECGVPLTATEKNLPRHQELSDFRKGKCMLCASLSAFETLLLRGLREIDSTLLTIRDVMDAINDNLPMAGKGI